MMCMLLKEIGFAANLALMMAEIPSNRSHFKMQRSTASQ
jgi:hypothetical protein